MAAKVISDLSSTYDIELRGVGGEALNTVGLKSIFPMQELSLMGVFEILPHVPKLLARIKQTTESIIAFNPDVVLSFDAPDFCFRVLKRYKKYALKNNVKNPAKLLHFVAPTVWAWRPGRAKKIAAFLDHIFCLFPFEPLYFRKVGLSASYIKHPFINGYESDARFDWKAREGIEKRTKLIGFLPGSRKGEIDRMFPVFLEAAKRIYQSRQDVHFVILTLPRFYDDTINRVTGQGIPVTITTDKENKESILSSCDFAMATSGTIGFELSLAKVPHLIAYKMNKLTAAILRKLVKTPYAHLLNIHLQEKVVPELIQEECTPERIGDEMLALMNQESKQIAQDEAFEKLYAMLDAPKGQQDVIGTIQSLRV